jgi:hypothetical protein
VAQCGRRIAFDMDGFEVRCLLDGEFARAAITSAPHRVHLKEETEVERAELRAAGWSEP